MLNSHGHIPHIRADLLLSSVIPRYQCKNWEGWRRVVVCHTQLPGVNLLLTQSTQQSFYGPLSGTTQVSRYQNKHSPTHHPMFISFFHLLRSIASSLFKLCARQFFCTTSPHVLFVLPLGLEPSTSYSIHFFMQSVSSFCNTCPYHRNLFCCSIKIKSSIPSLSLNSLLGTLLP